MAGIVTFPRHFSSLAMTMRKRFSGSITIIGLFMAAAIVVHPAQAGEKIVAGEAQKHMIKAPEIDFEHLRDPFQSYLEIVRQRLAEKRKALTQTNRPREPLEAFDLSALKLVAIYRMGNKQVAMVEDTTGKGYVVRPGSHIGQNGGKVVRIEKDAIVIVEKAVAPNGDIVDREVRMTIKEVNEPAG